MMKKRFLYNKKSLKQLKSITVIEILGTIQTMHGFATHLIKLQQASKTENILTSTIIT